jgi:predicted Zn-dependent peptidase
MASASIMRELYPNCYEERLTSGLKVLVEPRPDRPLSLGIWARLGSRDEPPQRAGITHFLEHMVFKGTTHRTAFQISEEIDALGGFINAMTSKEYTAYYVDVLPEHLDEALDVLADLVKNPLLRPEDIDREKNVVLEEIRMQEDSPQDKVFELFSQKLWDPTHPLARPIAGTLETVSSLARDDLVRQFELYDVEHLFLAAVGGVRPEDVLHIAEEKLGDLRRSAEDPPDRTPPEPHGGVHIEDRDLQQAHICLGTPGLARRDPRRYALEVLSAILGGGMSSRLFKRIREELGLAYAVYSNASYFSDSGLFVIYIGTEPANAPEALAICHEEIERIFKEPVPDETLDLAKEKLKGNLLLGLESSHARMIRLGFSEIYQTHWPIEDVIAHIEAVTVEDVQRVAEALFEQGHFTLTVVGPERQLSTLEQTVPVS